MRRIVAAALIAACAVCLTGCAQSDMKKLYAGGNAALTGGDTAGAIAAYDEVIASGYFVPEAYRGRGLAQMLEGNYPDAAISLEKALLYMDEQGESFRVDVNRYLAYCRERQGKADKALAIYNEMILKNPDAETLFLRGRLNLRTGRSAEAEADFNQAVQLKPSYELFINIFQIYNDMERSGDGAKYLEMALTEANKSEDDYYERALVSYYLQNYSDARELLIQAARKEPENGQVIFLLGQVYLATDDIADARAIYKAGTEKESTAAGAYNGLALCDIAQGNYESALANVQAGLAVAEGDALQGLLYNEIVLNEKLSNWDAARQKAAAYIMKYPSDEAGLREYEFLTTR